MFRKLKYNQLKKKVLFGTSNNYSPDFEQNHSHNHIEKLGDETSAEIHIQKH